MKGAPMTAVFDNNGQVEAATLPSMRSERAGIGSWLADQWPKAAIAVGIALTVVWIAVLAWLVGVVLGLI
jgi:hypothetical protein